MCFKEKTLSIQEVSELRGRFKYRGRIQDGGGLEESHLSYYRTLLFGATTLRLLHYWRCERGAAKWLAKNSICTFFHIACTMIFFQAMGENIPHTVMYWFICRFTLPVYDQVTTTILAARWLLHRGLDLLRSESCWAALRYNRLITLHHRLHSGFDWANFCKSSTVFWSSIFSLFN